MLKCVLFEIYNVDSNMCVIDSCKLSLTPSQIEQAIEDVKGHNISIDSAKTIYAINKVQDAKF